jgi:AraC-like DNA-binding protein
MNRKHQITSLYHASAESGIGRITTLARLEDSRGTPGQTMRSLDCYALVYVYDGRGVYQDPHQTRRIQSGDLMMIPPGCPHTYGPDGNNRWNELFLLFEGAVFNLWHEKKLLAPDRAVINLQPIPLWMERFQSICGPDIPALQQICRLQSFLAKALTRNTALPGKPTTRPWLDEANHLLLENLGTENAPQQAARSLGLSYEGFRKKYKRMAGCSPRCYCSQQIMDRAAKRLVETDLPIRSIAEELGFCDEFHFSRRFKQVVGLSPTTYRQRLP